MESKVDTNDISNLINGLKEHIIILEHQIRQNQKRQHNRESCLIKCIALQLKTILEQLPNIDKAKLDSQIQNEIDQFKIKCKKLSDDNLEFVKTYFGDKENESTL